MTSLPIDALRPAYLAHRPHHPLVVSAPTGSGKSTQIPRWSAAAGPVLVIEPRRVACQSLAARVAELEATPLGHHVGYRVRDDDRSRPDTHILFATPGVALRMIQADSTLAAFTTLILDEFHERSLDTDLLFALLAHRRREALVVMSATLDADRIATHLDARHLHGEGRMYPVAERHIPGDTTLPDPRGLEHRLLQALRAAADDPGDILVFLPGKAEIAAATAALRAAPEHRHSTLVPLHGALTLDEQARAFAPAPTRKIILATNVAETSLTLPGVGVVIDAGLVRRTRYHAGRGHLTLLPIALDAAAQRAGRAGRTAPGVCYRLWSPAARLNPHTPPEIHRESLVPLLLAAAACDAPITRLPFLDPPAAHALASARDELTALGALDPDAPEARLTPRGHALFGLPLDPPHGRLLIEAATTGALDDAIDLIAALAIDRPLFRPGPPPTEARDDLRDPGCDAHALIRAIRIGDPDRHHLNPWPLAEARRTRRRLRRAFDRPDTPPTDAPIDRRRLALTALAADPRAAHVARARKRHTAWSNGGTELELARESAVARALDDPHAPAIEALIVLDTHALGHGARDTTTLITCAMPAPIPWLITAGIGRERLARVTLGRGRLIAHIERVHARRVLTTREDTPEGPLAREALRALLLDGRLWPETITRTRDRLEARALHARLEADAGRPADPVPPLEDWLTHRIAELGFETADDINLLDPDDLLAADLPAWIRDPLDKTWPRHLAFADVEYTVTYDLTRRTVTLHKTAGRRRDPPPITWLPSFRGFAIVLRDERGDHPIRARVG